MAITTIWSDRRRFTITPGVGRVRFEETEQEERSERMERTGGDSAGGFRGEFLAREPGPYEPEPERGGKDGKGARDAKGAKGGNTRGRKRKPGLFRDRVTA